MRSYSIGSICSFTKGASVPRDRMSNVGDYLYLHYGDLYKGHELYIDVEDPQKLIPFISHTERIHNNQFIDDGDIVYVLTSETVEDLGKALYLHNPLHRTVVAGTETTVMRILRKDLIHPAWLNYYVQTPRFKKILQQYATGMKVFRVNPRDISLIEIELPSLETQQRAIAILDTIHKKLRINNQINDYLEELALAIYTQELEWQKADLPNGWDFRPLSDFFPVVTGKKDANIASENGTYPFFTCKQSALMADVYSFDGSAILVAGNGDFNVKWYEGKFEAYQRTYVLMPNNPALLGYLYCAVKRNLSKITSGSRGSVIKFITKGNIADYEIAVPPNLEQSDIVNQLRFILELIDAHKQEIVKLEAMRDTLLPKLMSGKIDVSHVDINQLNMQFIV